MKKLSTLLAIATFATTLGVAGCKNKSADSTQPAAAEKPADQTAPAATPAPAADQAKPADQAAPAAPGGAAAPAAPAGTAPAGTAPAAGAAPAGTAPAAAMADLPKECQDYKADIEKLSTCDKLPQQTRDSLKQAFDTASASWASLTPEAKANLSSACKAGAQAVEQSAKSACGW